MAYTTYDNITVRQYQEIFKIQRSEMTDIDKITQSICVLTSMTERQVEEMSILDFNKVAAALAFIFSEKIPETKPPKYIKAGGQLYGITYNPKNTSYYQYADIQAWISQNAILNMHKVVASLSYPVNKYGFLYKKGKNDPLKHPEVAEAFLDCKYKDIHAICVFFSLLWNNSIKALAVCFGEDRMMTPKQRQEAKKLLQILGDGFTTVK
jgi:hypothetical protein